MDTDILQTVYSIDSADTAVSMHDTPVDFYNYILHIGFTRIFKNYTRTYMKIQDLLAQVGGVIKAIFTIFQLLNYIFNEYYLDQYLLSITGSSMRKDSKTLVTLNKQKNKEIDKSNKEASITKLQINNNLQINNFTDLNSSKDSQINKSSLSIWSYVAFLFLCPSSSAKKAKDYLIRLTSFETYLSLYHEFINFKQMMMNETQAKAFGLIDTPDSEPIKYDDKAMMELTEYYKNKLTTKSTNNIDQFIYDKISLKLNT